VIMTDQEILDAVNRDARRRFNLMHGEKEKLPPDYRCDRSRVGAVRRQWERAVEEHKKATGVDPIEALARIEAELRSPANAPELYVDRR